VISPASDPDVRATGLGGSDIAQVLGLSRFGGPMDVFMQKRRLSAPLVETAPMRWGKLLEEPIAREYATITGRKVFRKSATIRHRNYPYLFAHIDRKAKGPGEPTRVLECKTASTFMVSDFGEPGTDEVPDDYLLQVQHYLGVTGLEIADLAVLIGGQKFGIYVIPRDDEMIAEIHAEAVRFWTEHVETGTPPEVDGSSAWKDYATSRFVDAGKEVEVTPELEALAYEYKAHTAAEKASKEAKEEVRNRLLVTLGDATRAEGKGIKITHSVFPVSYPSYKSIIEAAKVPAAIIEEFTRTDTEHRITVTIKAA
jgi:putative phage-type endonuclease